MWIAIYFPIVYKYICMYIQTYKGKEAVASIIFNFKFILQITSFPQTTTILTAPH